MSGKTECVYLIRCEEPTPKRDGLTQTRAYSDRDEALAEFSRLHAANHGVWWGIEAIDLDNHREWFWEEPNWRQLSVMARQP